MTKRSAYPRFIRASELARWEYCHRAWWLQVIRGYSPANRAALRAGEKFHSAHGRRVWRARFYRTLALALLAIAAMVILIAVVLWLL